MADKYVMAKSQSGFEKLIESKGGLILGIFLVLFSIFLLWSNENRTNTADIARTSVQIDASSIGKSEGGNFVSLTGNINAASYAQDPMYLLPGKFLKIERVPEMYVWQETKKSGSAETTYDYAKKWATEPQNSMNFQFRVGHDNPFMQIRPQISIAASGKIGAYFINLSDLALPPATDLKLTPNNVLIGGFQRLDGDFLYIGNGSNFNPQIGDTRIKFRVIDGTTADYTIFGQAEGDKIVPHMYLGKEKIYKLVKGTRDEALAALSSEYSSSLWGIRIVGILMLVLGGYVLIKKTKKS
ncbi:MAG: TMEM43 family protein [Candidatus Margulisiibacteriota bacterium]